MYLIYNIEIKDNYRSKSYLHSYLYFYCCLILHCNLATLSQLSAFPAPILNAYSAPSGLLIAYPSICFVLTVIS